MRANMFKPFFIPGLLEKFICMYIALIQCNIRSLIRIYDREKVYIKTQIVISKNTISQIIFQSKTLISTAVSVPHIFRLYTFCETTYFSTILWTAKTRFTLFNSSFNLSNKRRVFLFDYFINDLFIVIPTLSIITNFCGFFCSNIRMIL